MLPSKEDEERALRVVGDILMSHTVPNEDEAFEFRDACRVLITVSMVKEGLTEEEIDAQWEQPVCLKTGIDANGHLVLDACFNVEYENRQNPDVFWRIGAAPSDALVQEFHRELD